MKVEYHPAIAEELRDIVDYYNHCSDGLGVDFLTDFEQQIFRIVSNPERWVFVESDIRRALMRRFPYSIYFRVVSEQTLRVLIVKHQRRHPDYGEDRT
jgi:plasmid stabilization system protein ParE